MHSLDFLSKGSSTGCEENIEGENKRYHNGK